MNINAASLTDRNINRGFGEVGETWGIYRQGVVPHTQLDNPIETAGVRRLTSTGVRLDVLEFHGRIRDCGPIFISQAPFERTRCVLCMHESRQRKCCEYR